MSDGLGALVLHGIGVRSFWRRSNRI
jgi:hypothetical protein